MSSLEVVVGRLGGLRCSLGTSSSSLRGVDRTQWTGRFTDPTEEQHELWRQRLAEFRESGSISVPIRGDDSAAAS